MDEQHPDRLGTELSNDEAVQVWQYFASVRDVLGQLVLGVCYDHGRLSPCASNKGHGHFRHGRRNN